VLQVITRPPGPLYRLLSAAPLARIGVFSYSLYLVHAPLQQLVWQYALLPLGLGPAATFALLAGVGCPLIIGFAYLFFLVAEQPLLRQGPALPATAGASARRFGAAP
jgi:peptidoglycan/LPS O-acetylase OafA/YrhL